MEVWLVATATRYSKLTTLYCEAMAMQSESFIARRTESLDAEKIANLVTRHTETVFGRVDVENIIEHANLSITLVGVDSGEILGHMALFDYPHAKSVDQSEWEEWIHENYQCKKASPLNSLFIHLCVAKDGYLQGAYAELLRATFMSVPLLQYVFLATSSGTKIGSATSSQLSAVFSNSDDPSVDLYVAERCEHFSMLHIRPAVVEDADDLMPIFSQYSSEMNKEYGEFFLAELIESQDDQHKTIVADVGGRAIGFLSVTTIVDADLLNSCYQLEPFYGLKHPVDEDEIRSTSTVGTHFDSNLTLLSSSESKVSKDHTPSGSGSNVTSQSSLAPPTGPKGSSAVVTEADPPVSDQHSTDATLEREQPVIEVSAQSQGDELAGGMDSLDAGTGVGSAGVSGASLGSAAGAGVGGAHVSGASLGSAAGVGGAGVSGASLGSAAGVGGAHVSGASLGTGAGVGSACVSGASLGTGACVGGDGAGVSGASLGTGAGVGGDGAHVSGASLGSAAGVGGGGSARVSGASLAGSAAAAGVGGDRAHMSVASLGSAAGVGGDGARMSGASLGSAAGVGGDGARMSGASLGSAAGVNGAVMGDAGVDGGADGGDAVKKSRKKQYSFKGSCNALAVQLFAIDDKYETRSMDLLPMVFNLFPGYDFLILSQPHSYPEFPLLTHFSRVPPRVKTSVSQELYVLHKCGLLHSFSVSHVTAADVAQVTKLLADIQGSSQVLEDVERYITAKRDPLVEGATPLSALVAKCANQVVGVAILRDERDMQYIRSHYNIEDFIYYDYHLPSEHAHLHHFILNPVFASYAKHFIKECLRLSHKSCLYYPLYPNSAVAASAQNARPHSIITALSLMVPIRPRRQIVYSLDKIGGNAPLDEVLQKRSPFALYHTNRKLTLEPKITVNSRVVVVGASDTSISFLESLIFSPHLYFTNITLVSPHNFFLTTEGPNSPSTHPVMTSSLCFTREQFSLLGLSTWVNTVKQKIIAINRPAQYIMLESEDSASLIHYDYLVLCTGMQYLVPGLPGRLPLPRNVFTVNGEHEATSVLQWACTKFNRKSQGDVVVYGNNLDAYSVLQAMLECGVPPDRLVLARPDTGPITLNQVVLRRLLEGLKDSGVKVWDNLLLRSWVMGEEEKEEGKIIGVFLHSSTDDYQIPCQAFIYVDRKHVDMQAFKAMNDSCLVFDKRLVITHDHATNDPLIYAAGPLTKFSRRYRADQWDHSCYNSYEVGQRLALTMLTKLDPTAEPWTDPAHNLDPDLLPVYNQYKAQAAYLPGRLHYLHVYTPTAKQQATSQEGKEFSTDTENGFMSIHLNQYRRVDEIMALSTSPLTETDNYLCLYNVHESYLNNMVQRFEDGIITDFYTFFREPWACAIFHDRFMDLMEEVKEQLESVPVKDEQSLVQYMHALLEENPDLSLNKYRQSLKTLFDDSAAKDYTEKKLFKYLQYNTHHLPMYAKPDMI